MVCRNMGSSSQWGSAVSVDIIPDGILLSLSFHLYAMIESTDKQAAQ